MRRFFLSLLMLAASLAPLRAVTLETLAEFEPGPSKAIEALVPGPGGALFGISNGGGREDRGTLFRLDDDGQMALVWTFTAGTAPGHSPRSGLALGADGALYGATSAGGAFGRGTLFRYAAAEGLTVLADLGSAALPGAGGFASLTLAADGALYGATDPDASGGCLFRIPPGAPPAAVALFTDAAGALPAGRMFEALLPAPDGALYGAAGALLFKVTPGGGAVALTQLVAGSALGAGTPLGPLAIGADGAVYGASSTGGASGFGMIFRLAPDGAVADMADFTGTAGALPGASPQAGLVAGPGGALYGMTTAGGTVYGTVFKYSPAGGAVHLISFGLNAENLKGMGTDQPLCALADGTLVGFSCRNDRYYFEARPTQMFAIGVDSQPRDLGPAPISEVPDFLCAWSHHFTHRADGSAFGFTTAWQPPGLVNSAPRWTVFRIDNDVTVHAVNRFTQSTPTLAGEHPFGEPFIRSDGVIFGLSEIGDDQQATLFEVSPGVSQRVLAAASYESPVLSGLIVRPPSAERADGSLYGTAFDSGDALNSGVYKVALDGSVRMLPQMTLLPPFARLTGRLLIANDGCLYGTTDYASRIYRVSPDDQTALVATFTGTSGALPGSGLGEILTEWTDGALYGTAYYGGATDAGVVYRCVPGGAVTILAQFTGISGALPGSRPSNVARAGDGLLYGATLQGGAADAGTIFRVAADGTVTSLAQFTGAAGALPGKRPTYSLVPGPDGALYGATTAGGANNLGTLFRVLPGGAVEHLASFGGALGQTAYRLERHGDDAVYGTTASGGVNGCGEIFRIAPSGSVQKIFDVPGTARLANTGGPFLTDARDGTLLLSTPRTSGNVFGKIYRVRFGAAGAQDDAFELTAAPLAVRANDAADEFGVPGVISAVSAPLRGTALLLADQTIRYTPGADFAGADTFTYTLRNPGGGTSTGTVTIHDTAPPVIAAAPADRTLAVGDTGTLACPDLRGEVSAQDPGGITGIVQTPAPGVLLGVGPHALAFTVADRAGNTAALSATLRAVDVTPPRIVAPALQILEIGGEAAVPLPDFRPLASATDNVGVATFEQTPVPGTSVAAPGLAVLLRATDASGNATEWTIQVAVAPGGVWTAAVSRETTVELPDGSSALAKTFGPPAINANGQLASRATLAGRGPAIVVLGEGATPRARALRGMAAPGTSTTFAAFSDPLFNDHGHVAFRAQLTATAATSDAGIWSGAESALRLIARTGAAAPEAPAGAVFADFPALALLPDDRVLFTATLRGGGVDAAHARGLWMDSAAGLRAVVREGDAFVLGGVPRVVKTFQFLPVSADAPGQTRSFAADGTLALLLVFTDNAQCIATFADGVWRDIATTGGTAPGANGLWTKLRAPAVSADGWVVFGGEVATPGALPRSGVFRFAPGGAGEALALSGAVTPAGGVWENFGTPVVAAGGAVAFFSEASAKRKRALWRSDAGGLQRLAGDGEVAPGVGARVFRRLRGLALSDDGRVLLAADLAARVSDIAPPRGIWTWPAGEAGKLVAREGANLAVGAGLSRITRLEFLPSVPFVGGQTRGFNAAGRLVFRAQLSDGRETIARALD